MFSTIKNRISRKLELKIYGGVVNRFDTREKLIALTFDDGPHPVWTPKLINLLNQFDAKATFFVVGENAQRYPGIIKKAADSGHAIGNHSWNHPSFPELTTLERQTQLTKCDEVIAAYNPEKLFRPPYGHLDKDSRREILKLGYKIIIWNLVVNDWENEIDLESMYETIEKKMKPGSIILLHDALFGKDSDRTQILSLVEKVLIKFGNDYSFLTIPQMERISDPVIRYWNFNPGS